MSTTTTTTEAPSGPETDEQTTEAPEGTDEQETTEDTTEDEPGDREASKLRKRAQAAEVDRDTARGQLDQLRRQVVEQASGLQKPAGLWAAEVDLDSLFTEDGSLDRDVLNTTVREAADRLGLARRLGNHVPREGGNPRPSGKSGWSDALKQH